MRHVPIDRDRMRELWADLTLTREEVAQRLGVSRKKLDAEARAMGMPPRNPLRNRIMVDPTPEEIAERASEIRERHMAMRRAEPACNTHSKVSKWRRGISQPHGV